MTRIYIAALLLISLTWALGSWALGINETGYQCPALL